MQIAYHSMLKFSRACYRIDQDGVNKRAKQRFCSSINFRLLACSQSKVRLPHYNNAAG